MVTGRPTHRRGSEDMSRQSAVAVIVVVAAASPAALMLDRDLLNVPGLAVPIVSRGELQAVVGNHPQQVALILWGCCCCGSLWPSA